MTLIVSQVPLALLSSSTTVPAPQLQEWLEGVLGSDSTLAQHIGEHRVVSVPALPSAASNAQLAQGLIWLAEHAPPQPQLQVTHLTQYIKD